MYNAHTIHAYTLTLSLTHPHTHTPTHTHIYSHTHSHTHPHTHPHTHTHSHLAKVCAMSKDLCKDCEEVMGGSNSQVQRTCKIYILPVDASLIASITPQNTPSYCIYISVYTCTSYMYMCSCEKPEPATCTC